MKVFKNVNTPLFSETEKENEKRTAQHYIFFGGSFDPLHNGHIALVNFVLEKKKFDKIFLVPVPEAPHKEQALFAYSTRLAFLQKTFANKCYKNKIQVSSIEKELPPPQYTYRTMQALEKKFPQAVWSILMGQDSFASLHKWKNAQELTACYQIYVAYRGKKEKAALELPSLNFAFAPLFLPNSLWDISSTMIKKDLTKHEFFDKQARQAFLQKWKTKVPPAVLTELTAMLENL